MYSNIGSSVLVVFDLGHVFDLRKSLMVCRPEDEFGHVMTLEIVLTLLVIVRFYFNSALSKELNIMNC